MGVGRRVIYAVLFLLCAWPATASEPPAIVAPSPDVNVYVIREYAEPRAWATTIKVDGKKIVAISNRHYTAVRLPNGHHHITFSWPFIATQQGGSIDVEIVGDERHYLFLTGVSRVVGGGSGFLTVRMGSGMYEASANTFDTACCKYQPPK